MTINTRDWPIPTGLTDLGAAAAETILTFLQRHDLTYHGGGGRFYSPEEWISRGEEYGTDSVLIIIHDGGAHASAFNRDYECPELIEELDTALRALGAYVEHCTHWYAAIYPLPSSQ